MSEKSIESNGMNNGSNRKNGNVRESFNSQWGFILACIGSAVGMGNIWMFSTRVSLYGGGAFLIPYIIFVVLIGATGVIGEMSLGRAARSGPIDAFGMICEKKGKRKLGEALGMIPVLGSLAMAIGYGCRPSSPAFWNSTATCAMARRLQTRPSCAARPMTSRP